MMAYASWSVVFGEQPSAAKWNILGTNDASFNDGTGIADSAILPKHLLTGTGSSWAWSGSYTPTITGSSSNPNIGSTGTITGRYTQIGKTIHFQVQVLVSGSGIAAGSGDYRISLPVTANSTYAAATANALLGSASLLASAVTYLGGVRLAATTYCTAVLWGVGGGASNPVQGFAVWGSTAAQINNTGNAYMLSGTYEAA